MSLTAPASSVPRASSRVFFPEGPLDLTVICGRMSCCVFGSSLLISSPSQASPAFLLACSCLCLARLLSAGSGSRWIYIERGPVAGVEVPMERRWLVELALDEPPGPSRPHPHTHAGVSGAAPGPAPQEMWIVKEPPPQAGIDEGILA